MSLALPSGAPIGDVSTKRLKETPPPPRIEKKNWLLIPVLGAVAAVAIIIIVVVTSTLYHVNSPNNPPPQTNPTNAPPIIQTANGYSFKEKWGANLTGNGNIAMLSWAPSKLLLHAKFNEQRDQLSCIKK